MVDAATVQTDVVRLKASYDATMAQIDKMWRRAALEPDPRRRASFERQAHDLQYQARTLAGVHERAIKALKKLENETG